MLGIVLPRHLGGDHTQLGGNDAEALSFESGDDLAREATLNAVWLHDDKGAIHVPKCSRTLSPDFPQCAAPRGRRR